MAFDSHSNFIEIQKLRKELSAKSGNLVRYDISHVATEDGQTEFPIDLTSFDFLTDSVLVQSGRTLLSPTLDYSVLEHSVILNEGLPVGRTVDIYVYKNVVNLDEEQTISGLQIGVGTIPLDRLEDVIPIEHGGTGATTMEEARTNLETNVKTFYALTQIDSSFDLTTPIGDIATAMPQYSMLQYNTYNATPNYPDGLGSVTIHKHRNNEYSIVTFTSYSTAGKSKRWIGTVQNGSWTGWNKLANAEDFLLLTGGTLTGNLHIRNSNGSSILMIEDALHSNRECRIAPASTGEINIFNMPIGNAATHARLSLQKEDVELNKMLQIVVVSNANGTKSYNIFGEHNTSLLASKVLNRSNAVNVANTSYTTLMARGTSLNSTETNPTVNGAIAWTYK